MDEKRGATDMQDRAHTPADNALNALLGRGSEFDGKLNFEGTVRIDGTFTGEIGTNDMLIIGEGAKVKGDITTPSLMVDKGVQFDGNSKMDSAGSNLVTLNRREGSSERP